MSTAPYNAIAEWYDRYLRENPIYQEVLLPALLELVGDVQGQAICDLACGQGWFSRVLSQRGAQITGIDLADRQLTLARQYEEQEPLGIDYREDDIQSASSLTENSFDGCVCILSLMDIANLQAVFHTMRRILKPGGWLVFAITHPCFESPHAQWLTTNEGQLVRVIQSYIHEGFWKSERGGVRSHVGAYHRMLSTYLNTLVAANLTLEYIAEPAAKGEMAEKIVGNLDIPRLLLIRARAV